MKQKVKITETKLRNIIKESIKKYLLNENTICVTYIPGEDFEDPDELPEEVKEVVNHDYDIRFDAYVTDVDATYSQPGYTDIDDMEVIDDDNFMAKVEKLRTKYPEYAKQLEDNFDRWCEDLYYNRYDLDWYN